MASSSYAHANLHVLNPLTQKMSSAFASKYIDRVTKITERLNDLHLNIEQEKFLKLESVD